MPTNDDALIRFAITHRRLLRFWLHGQVRIVEPHDYGVRNGAPQLLVYQVRGESKSGRLPDWRWVMLAQASRFEVLDETFPGGRTAPSGKHSEWQELYLRVEPASAV